MSHIDHWPFLPLIIMIFTSFINFLPKKVFLLIYLPLLIWNFYIGISYIHNFNLDPLKRGINSWAYNKMVAENIYGDVDSDFGYYIFTPDRWVYNQWYALKYLQNKYPDKIAHPFAKQSLTYLLVVDPPKDRPDIDSTGWRISDIKINKEAEKIWRLDVIQIQKYQLTEEETKIPSNPYLLNSTFFR